MQRCKNSSPRKGKGDKPVLRVPQARSNKYAARTKRNSGELEAAQAELQRRLDELEKNKPAPRSDENLLAQANIPSVTLESSRDAGSAARVTIPAEAKSILLQIPVEPGNRFQSFTLEVMTRNKAPIESVNGARPNRSGSLVVRASATRLEAGDYRVRLYGVNQTQREFLAEYDLRVVRK